MPQRNVYALLLNIFYFPSIDNNLWKTLKRSILKTYFCVLFIIFSLCENSLAHQHYHISANNTLLAEDKTNTDTEVQAIAQLTHILHQAIEDQHLHIHSVKDFFKAFQSKEQWMQLLNFHQTTRRTIRAFNMESNKNNLANHAKNLALLFPLSHFIEVMTAPAFIAIGTAYELPSVVIGFGGSLFSIIAVPGLDPLCILLLSAYPLKPVHKSIDFIRQWTEKSIKGTVSTLKLDTLLSKTYTYEDRFRFIKKEFEKKKKLKNLFDIEWTTLTNGHQLSLSNKINGSKILSLKRMKDPETNQFYLESIWISQTAEHNTLRNVLHLLSWNARSAVRELLKIQDSPQKIQSYEREFFVDHIDRQAYGIEVVYKEKAINLKDKFQFKSLSSFCRDLFQKTSLELPRINALDLTAK